MLVHITRKEHFNVAHRIYRDEWTEEEKFQDAPNPNWRWHNYSLFVTVKGELFYEKGYLMDLWLAQVFSRVCETCVH